MKPNWKLWINGIILHQNHYSDAMLGDDINYFMSEWANDSPYINAKTSGSTGSPKEIKLSKTSMIESAKMTISVFDLKAEDDIFCPISARFIAGKMMIVRAIVGRMRLHFPTSHSDPTQYLQEKKYSFGVFTPHQITQIIENGHFDELKVFDKILLGGQPVSAHLELFLSKSSTAFYLGYGMTETMSHVAIRKLLNQNEPIFKACPNVHFSVDPEQCLIINAPLLLENPIITNDVVQLIDKYHFKWVSRRDYIINSGGIKLNPIEIEEKIRPFINAPFYIVGISHSKYGARPCLIIKSDRKVDKNYLINNMKSVLHSYEMPEIINIVKEFEYTENGKLKRIFLQ